MDLLAASVAMGLAGGGKGTPGVSSGALPLLWRFWLLLLVSVLEVEAQTAEDTKPIYIWQTGMLLPRLLVLPVCLLVLPTRLLGPCDDVP